MTRTVWFILSNHRDTWSISDGMYGNVRGGPYRTQTQAAAEFEKHLAEKIVESCWENTRKNHRLWEARYWPLEVEEEGYEP